MIADYAFPLYTAAALLIFLAGYGAACYVFYWLNDRPKRRLRRAHRRLLRYDHRVEKLVKKVNDLRYENGMSLMGRR